MRDAFIAGIRDSQKNRAQDALASDANEATMLDAAGAHALPKMDKLALARRLVEEIAQRVKKEA